MNIGILALQGAFAEHMKMLETLHANGILIRQKSDLSQPLDGLILPGGESTAMGKLLFDLDILEPVRERILEGLPVFGTCAGMILLAKQLEDSPIRHLATMDITVRRNAYGRQLGSFTTTAAFGNFPSIPMTFIRAPFITQTGNGVTVLSTVNGNKVAARQGNQLVTAFHPELTDSVAVHSYFLDMVQDRVMGEKA